MADLMRCWQLVPSEQAYRLEQGQKPVPVPGPGRVVVRVRAASLNYRDHIGGQPGEGGRPGGGVLLSVVDLRSV
jgi:NADPH:quinone reductase-like Zn-dependent oxidoreductase